MEFPQPRKGRARHARRRAPNWLRWTLLALFWATQVAIAAWFVGYQTVLAHSPRSGVDLGTPLVLWLIATLLLGAAIVKTAPRSRDRGRHLTL